MPPMAPMKPDEEVLEEDLGTLLMQYTAAAAAVNEAAKKLQRCREDLIPLIDRRDRAEKELLYISGKFDVLHTKIKIAASVPSSESLVGSRRGAIVATTLRQQRNYTQQRHDDLLDQQFKMARNTLLGSQGLGQSLVGQNVSSHSVFDHPRYPTKSKPE